METLERLCAVCAQPLPTGSRKDRQFCSKACRDKSVRRRAKGQPIADATATPGEIANLRLQLVQQQNANVQLQKALAKAEEKAATANRCADRKHAVIATREKQIADEKKLHSSNLQATFQRAEQRNMQLQQENIQLKQQILKLKTQVDENLLYLNLLKEHRELVEYVSTLTKLYQRLYAHWYTLQANYVLVCKDFLDFATYVSQTKPQHKLTPQDFDRFKRAKVLRRKMPQLPRRKQPRMP